MTVKLRFRDLQRLPSERLVSQIDSQAIGVTVDGVVVAVVLSVKSYNELVKDYKKPKVVQEAEDVVKEAVPWYNPAVHKAGDRVKRQWRGKTHIVTVPELDGDGHQIGG